MVSRREVSSEGFQRADDAADQDLKKLYFLEKRSYPTDFGQGIIKPDEIGEANLTEVSGPFEEEPTISQTPRLYRGVEGERMDRLRSMEILVEESEFPLEFEDISFDIYSVELDRKIKSALEWEYKEMKEKYYQGEGLGDVDVEAVREVRTDIDSYLSKNSEESKYSITYDKFNNNRYSDKSRSFTSEDYVAYLSSWIWRLEDGRSDIEIPGFCLFLFGRTPKVEEVEEELPLEDLASLYPKDNPKLQLSEKKNSGKAYDLSMDGYSIIKRINEDNIILSPEA